MARQHLRRARKQDLSAAPLTVGPPEVGAPTLTVGEIAEQLRPFAPATTTIERIRHWTRENLLTPVENHHGGTGTRRKYNTSIRYDAAVLSVIANAGLHITAHRYLLDGLSQVRQALQKWKPAKSGDLYLEIAYPKDSDPIFAIHESSVKPHPNARLSIVLNLTEIFLDVGQAKGRALGQKG
jgi:DNA-binding transcriptional MerR regulator